MITDALTVEQAAEALGVSAARVYQILERGQLRFGKHGRMYIIERSALREYIERQLERARALETKAARALERLAS